MHMQMPHMQQYLQHMEPLPKLPELQDAQAMLEKLHSGVSLAAELEHFVGRAAALPAVLRSRALAAMETGMSLRRHELLLPEGYGHCLHSLSADFLLAIKDPCKGLAMMSGV